MTIKLYHKDATGCSVEGVAYEPGADGAFDVADEHAPVLLDHGFTTAPEVEAEDAPAKTRGRRKAQVEE